MKTNKVNRYNGEVIIDWKRKADSFLSWTFYLSWSALVVLFLVQGIVHKVKQNKKPDPVSIEWVPSGADIQTETIIFLPLNGPTKIKIK